MHQRASRAGDGERDRDLESAGHRFLESHEHLT
jgi:hypothetical protein